MQSSKVFKVKNNVKENAQKLQYTPLDFQVLIFFSLWGEIRNQRTAPPPGVAATSALNVETAAHQQRTVSFNAGPSHVLPSHLTSQVNSVNDKKVKHWKFCIILALFQCLLLGLFMKVFYKMLRS